MNIIRYINQSMRHGELQNDNNFIVSNIFRMNDRDLNRDPSDIKVFNGLHNHFMLWHGTKNSNIMGILNKGLKIKPPGAVHCASLFGDAIYFSDTFTKALNYSSLTNNGWAEKKPKFFYVLLCEVALGNIANYSYNWSDEVYRPPQGYQSVRIMSKYGPDFN